MMQHRLAAGATIALFLAACNQQKPASPQEGRPSPASQQATEKLMEQLVTAKPGDVIAIPAGLYSFDRSLSLATPGVTLRGEGMDKTILSFKGQIAGAEGLLVTGGNFLIEDLAIEDSKGDALKVNGVENVIIRRVRAEWTNGPDTKNGAYGIYPVQTRNVLIDGAVAIGASDAGIYVGQSVDIVVRNSRAEYNVAGIEIENSVNADVHDNVATNNSGGILIFNMPNLPQAGHSTRVFHNRVNHNNTDNFAAKGTVVATVPTGSGVIVNSNDLVEIFDNDIGNNRTANVIVSSYFSTGYMTKEGVAKTFDPWAQGIHVHGNRFQGGGDKPGTTELLALKTLKFGLDGRLPDILWDGFVNPSPPPGTPPALCVDNAPAEVLNADGPNRFRNPKISAIHGCTLPRLPAVTLDLSWAEGAGR
ncbi:right-handed parallel beta-helix repeat-containing protein [Sandaracinobacter sp. RS1-74]|uniref:parallel beta-helix domain-containing protein n=1 Tax=Sandaracinobacteroides sayramensis TaxID=2913411 RepID=UPI001EDBCE2D|nr:parallel beta-helix domain-containing protein [Sandaracinobacteroides sayramensis]MCG2841015.1 right-handed parallel beta-helix repeat-containing protein [Sandaracinobacteroides sayramensis]